MSQAVFDLNGLTERLQELVAGGASDEEIAEWLQSHAASPSHALLAWARVEGEDLRAMGQRLERLLAGGS
jgi:hypothetical protein